MKDRMKRLAVAIVAAGMVVGFGSTAFARGPHNGPHHDRGRIFEKLEQMDEQERLEFMEDRVDRRVEKMSKHLDLTDDQEVKVRQIFADANTQLLEIWELNKDAADKSSAKAEAHTVLKQAKQDVGDVLTQQQKAKAKELRKKRVKRGKRFMLERLDDRLDLTDKQQAEVKAIMDDAHTELKALRDSGVSREEVRPKAKEILEGAADEINTLLDADQQAEYAEIRAEMKERRGKLRKRMRGKRGKDRGKF